MVRLRLLDKRAIHRRSSRRFSPLLVEPLEERALLAPIVQYQLHVVALGAPFSAPNLTTVKVGQLYDLAVSVQDLRPEGWGVHYGFIDIGYDSSKTQIQAPEIQHISIGPFKQVDGICPTCFGGATGTFTLDFGGQTTAPITYTGNYNVLPLRIQAALEDLDGIGIGNVHVSNVTDRFRDPENTFLRFRVQFFGKHLGHDVPNMTVASQELSGPTNPQVALEYDGDLQGGITPLSFTEAFRARDRSTAYYGYYSSALSAQNMPNLLDEVGAQMVWWPVHPGTEPRELVRARFMATEVGTIPFVPDLLNVDHPAHDTRIRNSFEQPQLADLDPGVAVTLNVVPNTGPIDAAADWATVLENSRGTTIDVLANDIAVTAEATKAVVSVTQPSHGTVTFTPANVIYIPDPNFAGPDTFTYTAHNTSADESSESSTATVTVTVTEAWVRYQLHVVPPGAQFTTPDLTSVSVGQSYDVVVTVQDGRSNGLGVVNAYLDIGYDSTKSRVRRAETQYIKIDYGTNFKGDITLNFGGEATDPIEYSTDPDIFAARIQSALDNLISIGRGNVNVWGRGGVIYPPPLEVLADPLEFTIAFRGKFFDQDVPNMAIAWQAEEGFDSPTVSIQHRGDFESGDASLIFQEALRSRDSFYEDGLRAVSMPNRIENFGAYVSAKLLNHTFRPGRQLLELARATFIATDEGTFTFSPDRATGAIPTQIYIDPAQNPSGRIVTTAPSQRTDFGDAKTLSVTKQHVRHNAVRPFDVTGPGGEPDDRVAPDDALAVINHINAFGAGPVPPEATMEPPYCDTNADDFVAPDDALRVINHLNAVESDGEGEPTIAIREPLPVSQLVNPISASPDDELVSLLALDVASQPKRRR